MNDMKVKVTGVVYLHNIGSGRMGRSSLLGHDILRSMCGANALAKVVVASTQWETLLHNQVHVKAAGAKCTIDYIPAKQFEAVATNIQEELVDLVKPVAQTEGAQKLYITSQTRRAVPATPDPPIAAGAPPLETTPSAIGANISDIMPGDRLFADRDDLIIVSVVTSLLHAIVLTCIIHLVLWAWPGRERALYDCFSMSSNLFLTLPSSSTDSAARSTWRLITG
jgi:hypothetical protein